MVSLKCVCCRFWRWSRWRSLAEARLQGVRPLLLLAVPTAVPPRLSNASTPSLARPYPLDHSRASSVAVLRGGDTLLLRAYGMADLEQRAPAVVTSQYRLGSVTKSFTAAAILQQVERGKLSLDDTLGKFFPEYTEWKAIRVRQLLNHTSGIPDYTSVGDAFNGTAAEDIPHDSIVGFVRGRPPQFEPGSKWSYSNTNYVLLGMILEQVTCDALRRVSRPRGLPPRRDEADGVLRRRHAPASLRVGVRPLAWKFVYASPIAMTFPFAAGALCSTAGDLASWARALRSGHVITEGSYRAMTTGEFAGRHPNPNDSTQQYGYGVGMGLLGAHSMVEHGGNMDGFNASFVD